MSFSSRGKQVSSFFNKRSSVKARFELPDRLKGGRIEKYTNYWKGVMTDYSVAMKELGQSCREKPMKTAMVGTTILSAWYANRHNPDEESFRNMMAEINNEITLVPELTRNKQSTKHQLDIVRAHNAGLLRHWNLGLFSILWKDNYSTDFSHFKSKCKYLTVGYTDILFHERERIVDIGFLDCWWYTKKAMLDHDICPEEWNENGTPRNSHEQLKPMW